MLSRVLILFIRQDNVGVKTTARLLSARLYRIRNQFGKRGVIPGGYFFLIVRLLPVLYNSADPLQMKSNIDHPPVM